MEYDETKNSWDKQPDEPNRWHEIFKTCYLPLGQNRTIAAAWRMRYPDKPKGRVGGEMQKMSRVWEWEKRASDYYASNAEKYVLEGQRKTKEFGSEIEKSKTQRIRIAQKALKYLEKCVDIIYSAQINSNEIDTENVRNMENISRIFDKISDRITTDFGTNPRYFDDVIEQAKKIYRVSISRNIGEQKEDVD